MSDNYNTMITKMQAKNLNYTSSVLVGTGVNYSYERSSVGDQSKAHKLPNSYQ